MYFKRIELNGFKSFADPVTIEFTEGITCIVGPNGSGKSNISDAILWVLGEQSPKTLRSDKLEEVIFSGTQSRKAKGMAEVTLVIDNTDHSLPIDFTEVGITRRAYRSGENEYMINRRPCRLKDIRELIMDTGIGVEGYSIVGQGKIADIVSNKMERRREIFEEAAGIVKYRSRKEKTEKSLEQAVINLSRVTDIIHEIESRIGGLEEDSRKAAEYLEIKEKYKGVEINIILKNIAAADEKTEAVREELAQIEAQVSVRETERQALEEQIRVLKERTAALDERLSSLRDGLLEATERIHEISSREELNRERLSALKKDEERIGSELAALDEKLEKQEQAASQAAEQYSAAKAEAETLAAELKDKNAAADKTAKALSDAEDKLSAEKNSLFETASRIQSAVTSGQSMESLRETLQKRVDKLSEESGLKEQSDREMAEKLAQSEDALKALGSESEGYKDMLKKALLAQARAENAAAEAVKSAAEARVASGKLSARRNLLDELEKAYEGYGGAVKFLMSRNMPGMIGTLGELLEVPKGYETAIETVLGGKLQNIVCRDDVSAKRAIELLKNNKAGRLTFLPLDDLKVQPPLSCKEISGMKGFLGLASDMVGCRGGHQSVVDYVLGNTVVIDNIDNAIRISAANKGPHKLVTLEGEVINAAGAITGGSFKNSSGNILSRKAEKDTLDEEIKALEKTLKDSETAREDAEKAKAAAADEKHRAEDLIKESDLKKALLEKELQIARQAVTDAEGAEAGRLAELAELKAEIARSVERAEEYAAEAERLTEEKKAKEAEAEALASETEGLKEALAAAAAEQTSARLAENAARLKAENFAGLSDMARQTADELKAEKQEKERALESARIQASQIAEFESGSADILAQAEAKRVRLEQDIEKISSEKKETGEQSDKADAEKSEADRKVYELQLKKHDAELRAARFDSQTESLKERLWQEYEMTYAEAAELEDPDFVMSRAMKESREFRDRLRALGDVNIGAIEEYKQVKKRYDFLCEQREDAQNAMDELRAVITEMDDIIRTRFKESFDSIVENFEAAFKELFRGGNASLTMSDPEHPLDSAIEIEAQPPGKKLQNISLLSGGERTLTAMALMFAVLKSKPTPFCILDEVEAALDEANIETFAKYVKKFENTQFALVTHQKLTMEYADALYGVTMPEHGISKVLSLKLGDDFEV